MKWRRLAVAVGASTLMLVLAYVQLRPRVEPIEDLPLPVQRAFEPTPEAFEALPAPGPGDWLAVHDEQPQSVEDYLDYANRPEPPREILYILPVGSLPAERGPTSEQLSSYAHAFFGLEVRVLPPLDDAALQVTRRVHYGTAQLNATDILDVMEPLLPDGWPSCGAWSSGGRSPS